MGSVPSNSTFIDSKFDRTHYVSAFSEFRSDEYSDRKCDHRTPFEREFPDNYLPADNFHRENHFLGNNFPSRTGASSSVRRVSPDRNHIRHSGDKGFRNPTFQFDGHCEFDNKMRIPEFSKPSQEYCLHVRGLMYYQYPRYLVPMNNLCEWIVCWFLYNDLQFLLSLIHI